MTLNDTKIQPQRNMSEFAIVPLPARLLLKVAIAVPLRRLFDYQMPAVPVHRGQRVKVPFGRRQIIGIAIDSTDLSDLEPAKIRPVLEVLDVAPISDAILNLLLWAADYYHYPPGEVVMLALPPTLRKQVNAGQRAVSIMRQRWKLSLAAPAPESLTRAPKQSEALQALQGAQEGLMGADLPVQPEVVRALIRKHWIVPVVTERQQAPVKKTKPVRLVLSAEQEQSLSAITHAFGSFQCLLLEGVTGSGKTEVYIRAAEHCLDKGYQTLMLVPEIGLTPQIFQYFEANFPGQVALIHSGMSAASRRDAWFAVTEGRAGILLGTRTALFTPMPRLGLIIVDEEHDSSYKQQDGFRYSARDLAVKRASDAKIPIVLGSATPALESLANVELRGYRHLHLSRRVGAATLPTWKLLNLRDAEKHAVLTRSAIEEMQACLEQGSQALLFINRRGEAPVLMCTNCGWVLNCEQCDARMVLHRTDFGRHMLCHHCLAQAAVPNSCPSCDQTELLSLGAGVQRFETLLQAQFPNHEVLRFDADMSTVQRLENLTRAHQGNAKILVGTQMLAKGHHFPHLTLTVIADADVGLFSADFRATERLAQLIMQVAGRSGRTSPGKVLVQTRNPDHPVLQTLLKSGYAAFARQTLVERRQAGLSPYAHLAIFRAEAPSADQAHGFLATLTRLARQQGEMMQAVDIWGPAPAFMERRMGLFRQQIVLCARQRNQLQSMMRLLIANLESNRKPCQVRWSVEVDPLDFY